MKKCPTCQKTFDDNMRFCQTDGTPLVEAAEPSDPYKTMVASKDEIAAALGSSSTAGSAPQQDEVLEIPSQGDQGIPKFQGGPSYSGSDENEGQVMEIPPLVDSSPASAPKSSEPSLNPPSFGDMSPPPSPFGGQGETGAAGYQQTMPPIPSPFGEPESSSEGSGTRPEFGEAETMVNQPSPFEPYQPASSPLEKASSAPEWTPPPAPEANWQNQPVGQDSPFQPPPAGVAAGQNKTLAIVSLVLGILSLFCCSWFIPGIAAIITGVMARGKAKNNPAQYGGEGLALGGIITGVISLILGAIVAMLYLGGMFASMGLNY